MKRIVCAVAVLLLVGCGSPTRNCEFKVSGTAKKAMVTYMIGSAQSQETVNLPWSKTFQHSSEFEPLTVSAQNQDKEGSVTVEVIADGKVLKSGSASNEYGVATAAATLSEFK